MVSWLNMILAYRALQHGNSSAGQQTTFAAYLTRWSLLMQAMSVCCFSLPKSIYRQLEKHNRFASMCSFQLTKGICEGKPSLIKYLVKGSISKISTGMLLGSLDFHTRTLLPSLALGQCSASVGTVTFSFLVIVVYNSKHPGQALLQKHVCFPFQPLSRPGTFLLKCLPI